MQTHEIGKGRIDRPHRPCACGASVFARGNGIGCVAEDEQGRGPVKTWPRPLSPRGLPLSGVVHVRRRERDCQHPHAGYPVCVPRAPHGGSRRHLWSTTKAVPIRCTLYCKAGPFQGHWLPRSRTPPQHVGHPTRGQGDQELRPSKMDCCPTLGAIHWSPNMTFRGYPCCRG